VFAYYRSFGKQKLLVVTNWRQEESNFSVPQGVKLKKGNRLVGNYEEENLDEKNEVRLKPYEAWAWFIENA